MVVCRDKLSLTTGWSDGDARRGGPGDRVTRFAAGTLPPGGGGPGGYPVSSRLLSRSLFCLSLTREKGGVPLSDHRVSLGNSRDRMRAVREMLSLSLRKEDISGAKCISIRLCASRPAMLQMMRSSCGNTKGGLLNAKVHRVYISCQIHLPWLQATSSLAWLGIADRSRVNVGLTSSTTLH